MANSLVRRQVYRRLDARFDLGYNTTMNPARHPRRDFLRTLAAGAAAVAAPRILSASNKSGLDPIVLGEGSHRYRVIHDWARLPGTHAFGNTHGVVEDASGLIHVKHTVHATSGSGDAICVFDPTGQFVRSWGPEFRGGAHGLHIAREGREEFLYLCDQARGAVVKTALDGERVWEIGAPLESGLYDDASQYHPTNVATAPDGTLFVADGYGLSWIHRYDARANYLGSFGGPGNRRGQLSCPHGLIVDTRGSEPVLLVADRSNRRIQSFTMDGRSRGFVTDELRSPCHFHTHGTDLLIPDLEARVTLFDANNRRIAHLGDGTNFGLRDRPREEFIPGRFIAPHGACFDRAGNIFVVEWVEVGRVTKLERV